MKKLLLCSFIISIFCLLFFACHSSKTGNKHVKICLQLSEMDASMNAPVYMRIIKSRLIAYGVPEENIHFVTKNNTLEIDVDHVDNPQRIVVLTSARGNLEYWETFNNETAFLFLAEANRRLGELFMTSADPFIVNNDTLNKPLKKEKTTVPASKDSSKQTLIQNIKNGKEAQKQEQKQFSEQYKKENPLFAYIIPNIRQVDGKQEFEKGPCVGFVKKADTMKVNHLLHLCFKKNFFPYELKLLWSRKTGGTDSTVVDLIAIKTPQDRYPQLDGKVITDAHQENDRNGTSKISIAMDTTGTRIWKSMTAKNTGKYIAFVLDNYVYCTPMVQSEIPSGRSEISGNFTNEEAEDFATILKFHALPLFSVVSISITEEQK
jgi:SecD/SecF fusion protein